MIYCTGSLTVYEGDVAKYLEGPNIGHPNNFGRGLGEGVRGGVRDLLLYVTPRIIGSAHWHTFPKHLSPLQVGILDLLCILPTTMKSQP